MTDKIQSTTGTPYIILMNLPSGSHRSTGSTEYNSLATSFSVENDGGAS